jgi:hypothetical protein
MTYEQLVAAIGRGFHPDISGDQYASLPEGITPELVDQVVADAFDADEAGGRSRCSSRSA